MSTRSNPSQTTAPHHSPAARSVQGNEARTAGKGGPGASGPSVSGIGARRRAAAVAALLTTAALGLTACSSGNSDPATGASGAPAATGASASAATGISGPPPAAAAGRVGEAGSACEMPIAFDLAEGWKAKPVEIEPDDVFADLAKKGPLTLACEIDAKPAGMIGFMRVWRTDKTGARAMLDAYMGKNVTKSVFADLRLGGRPAVEADYRTKGQLDTNSKGERAFAVETATGTAVVVLDSFDTGELNQMLPAYELAKSSLQVR